MSATLRPQADLLQQLGQKLHRSAPIAQSDAVVAQPNAIWSLTRFTGLSEFIAPCATSDDLGQPLRRISSSSSSQQVDAVAGSRSRPRSGPAA